MKSISILSVTLSLALLSACSTKTNFVTEDLSDAAATEPSSGAPAPKPPSSEAGVRDAALDVARSCTTATCTSADDCARPLGGKGGCWQCVTGCCAPVEAGRDPSDACASDATACKTSTCDGAGGCVTQPAGAGTACGTVCEQYTGTIAWAVQPAKCDGRGECKVDDLQAHVATCSGGTSGCTVLDNCGSCPPSGCAAHCVASGAPSCP